MADDTIRIFSDLHFLEGSCRVLKFEQLLPLLAGADELIFNGDTVDTQIADPDQTIAHELKTFLNKHAATTFITGNHDPDISDLHELSIADGAVWLTHGDVFFDDLVPWSHDAYEARRRLKKAWGNTPAPGRRLLEKRLPVFRQICHGLPRRQNPRASGHFAMLWRITSLLYPPQYACGLLYAWTAMNRLAAHFAQQRPKAKFILYGHTHRSGVWKRSDGRVMINTGSFCAPLDGLAVELQGAELRVRPVILRDGEFSLAPPTKTFALPAPARSVLSTKT